MKRTIVVLSLVVASGASLLLLRIEEKVATPEPVKVAAKPAAASPIATPIAPIAPPAPSEAPCGPPATGGDRDLDELSRELALRPEQRDRVRVILMDTERELDRALREDGGTRTETMRAATDRVLARCDVEVAAVLDADQRATFERLNAQDR